MHLPHDLQPWDSLHIWDSLFPVTYRHMGERRDIKTFLAGTTMTPLERCSEHIPLGLPQFPVKWSILDLKQKADASSSYLHSLALPESCWKLSHFPLRVLWFVWCFMSFPPPKILLKFAKKSHPGLEQLPKHQFPAWLFLALSPFQFTGLQFSWDHLISVSRPSHGVRAPERCLVSERLCGEPCAGEVLVFILWKRLGSWWLTKSNPILKFSKVWQPGFLWIFQLYSNECRPLKVYLNFLNVCYPRVFIFHL